MIWIFLYIYVKVVLCFSLCCSTEHIPGGGVGSARTSASCSLASSRESSTSNPGPAPYRVLMLGGPAVGKSSLVSQFMTSEYLHAYDTSLGE